MEIIMAIVIILIQVSFCICSVIVFLPLFKDKGQKETYRRLIKVVFSLVTLACFRFIYNEDEIKIIFPNNGFEEYMILTLSSVLMLSSVYVSAIIQNKVIAKIGQVIIGILFWLSLLTAIKFAQIIAFVAFPVYGLMVFAPYAMLVMSTYEINYIRKLKAGFSFIKTLLFSLIFLLVFQLFMNFWGEENWELIKLFTLDYKLI